MSIPLSRQLISFETHGALADDGKGWVDLDGYILARSQDGADVKGHAGPGWQIQRMLHYLPVTDHESDIEMGHPIKGFCRQSHSSNPSLVVPSARYHTVAGSLIPDSQ